MFKLHILLTIFFISFLSFGMAKDRGAANPTTIARNSINYLLQKNVPKMAMVNYLNMINIAQIEDKEVNNIFRNLLRNNKLQEDILIENNYVISDSCEDFNGESVPASSAFGDLGGDICFNVRMLAEKYKGMSESEMMIRLASLTIHEHFHHFQKDDSSRYQSYEKQANLLASYIQLTARSTVLPSLKWTRANGKSIRNGKFMYYVISTRDEKDKINYERCKFFFDTSTSECYPIFNISGYPAQKINFHHKTVKAGAVVMGIIEVGSFAILTEVFTAYLIREGMGALFGYVVFEGTMTGAATAIIKADFLRDLNPIKLWRKADLLYEMDGERVAANRPHVVTFIDEEDYQYYIKVLRAELAKINDSDGW